MYGSDEINDDDYIWMIYQMNTYLDEDQARERRGW